MSFGWDNKDHNTLWHVQLVDRLGFRRKVGSKGPPGKLHNLSFFHSHRRYVVGILPLRRKTQDNQTLNQLSIAF